MPDAIQADEGKCTFETLVEEYSLTDPALLALAEIIHGADVSDERTTPQSDGLRAIGEGFLLDWRCIRQASRYTSWYALGRYRVA